MGGGGGALCGTGIVGGGALCGTGIICMGIIMGMGIIIIMGIAPIIWGGVCCVFMRPP